MADAEDQGGMALVGGERRLSPAELQAEVASLAAWLTLLGLRPGDRVAIHLPKSVDEVVATLAVRHAGGVFVNVHVGLVASQLEHVLRDSQARLLLTFTRAAAALASDLPDLEGVIVRGAAPARPGFLAWDDRPALDPQPPVPRAEGDLAALIYTSGSTGLPKGVMVTHGNLRAGAASVVGYLGNTAQDRVLSVLPLSFDYGLNQLFTMLRVGGTLVLPTSLMPADLVETIQAEGITGIALVPPLWVQLAGFLNDTGTRLPSLRYATNSGGAIPRAVLERLPTLLPDVAIILMYGLTEGFRATYLPASRFLAKMGAIGQAVPGAEVFVVDPEQGLCAPGQTGELIQRGPLVSRGYWRDAALTEARIHPNPHLRPLIGLEPVLHSGDLVTRDEDGCLWYVGRTDHQIKCSGFRVSPTEVEELVGRCGLVAEALAFGVPHEALGQVIHLVVTGARLDAHALLRHCRAAMPGYMVPHRIHLWDGALPRTSTGKYDRAAVVKALAEAPCP